MNIWGISFRSAYRSEAGDPDRRAMAQESREKISYRFDLRKQTRKRKEVTRKGGEVAAAHKPSWPRTDATAMFTMPWLQAFGLLRPVKY